jgi:2-polyprenyl-3-methyl-5-hydroxy-6-metoxy-1,4-benzoquinol methylase
MPKLKIELLDNKTIEEVASFLDIGFEQCKKRILDFDDKEMAEEWKTINPKTPNEIRDFYKNTELYIFDLTQANASLERRNFHGRAVDYLFTHFPANKYNSVLDFGSGVGEEVVIFSEKGYDVTFCDVVGRTSEFVNYRLKNRNLKAKFIPVESGLRTLNKKYDIIIVFDVLEHLPNAVSILRFLVSRLSNDGVIAIINCPYDDGDHPCHLSSTFAALGQNWPQTLDAVGLVPLGQGDNLYKKPGWQKNIIGKFRFVFWKLTSLYVIRVPRG